MNPIEALNKVIEMIGNLDLKGYDNWKTASSAIELITAVTKVIVPIDNFKKEEKEDDDNGRTD